jgi:hypothetical protein
MRSVIDLDSFFVRNSCCLFLFAIRELWIGAEWLKESFRSLSEGNGKIILAF